jgi:hypothetical protein
VSQDPTSAVSIDTTTSQQIDLVANFSGTDTETSISLGQLMIDIPTYD